VGVAQLSGDPGCGPAEQRTQIDIRPKHHGGTKSGQGSCPRARDPTADAPPGRLVEFAEPHEGNRMNEMKADPAGRLWASTMRDHGRHATGVLYRVEDGHTERVRADIRVPNATCYSELGDRI